MLTAGMNGFVDRLRRGMPADGRTDGELVREYATTGNEATFAELVRRFAPLVWGVCHRTVPDRQLAEDAFQATFLVLIRKAGAVRPNAVGGWLHTVAVHTSTRARAMADRRKTRVHPLADHDPAGASSEPADPDTIRVLDEEISRLPESLRAAVVLCELDGVSRRDAAKRLGIAEGTLSSRLASARKRLAARLRGRGIALAAAFALVSQAADAAPTWTPTTSEIVSSLADGVTRTMFLSKLKLTAVAIVAVAVLGVGAAWAAPPDRYQIKAPVPKVDPKEEKILFWLDEKPLLLTSDGTELPSPAPIPNVHHSGSADAQLSADGKRIAYQFRDNNHQGSLKILDLAGKDEEKTLAGMTLNHLHWLGNGKTLYVRGYPKDTGKLSDWVYDPATDKLTPLEMPKDFFVRAVAPDGKTVVADEWKMTAATWHQHAHLWTIGSNDKPTPLFELNQSFKNLTPRFSPDGKRLLCRLYVAGPYTPIGNGQFDDSEFKSDNLLVIDLKTKKQTVVKEIGQKPEWWMCGFAWSPDGKRVAYVERQPFQTKPFAERFRVTVADADGSNAKEIHTATGAWLVGFDWK